MELTFVWYMLATVAVMGLTRLAGQAHPSFRMAKFLLLIWALCQVTPARFEPWVDAAGFYFCYGLFFSRCSRWWLTIHMALFLIAIVFNLFAGDLHNYYRQSVLNGIYAIHLLVAAIAGGMTVARRFRDRRPYRRFPRPAAARSSSLAFTKRTR